MIESKHRYECKRCGTTFVGLIYGPLMYFIHRLIDHRPRITIRVDKGDGWIRQRKE